MEQNFVKLLIYIYSNIKRSYSLRRLIKKIIGNRKIQIGYNGFKVNAGITTALESSVVFNSYNEITVLKIIEIFASKGYSFIDIGANIGLHSLTAARSNSQIEIYSFEPEIENYQNFIKNIALNEYLNIRPFKMGLGNFTGNFSLNINENWNKGKHSIKVSFGEINKKINIPLTKLDCFEENIKCEFLLIKIDVEGFEKEVIEGAKHIVANTKNIIIIIELLIEINGDSTCEVIFEDLKQSNFGLVYKITTDNELIKVLSFDGSADYVFIKGQDSIENFILMQQN